MNVCKNIKFKSILTFVYYKRGLLIMKNKSTQQLIRTTIIVFILISGASAIDSETSIAETNAFYDGIFIDCPADNGNGYAYDAWEYNWKCNIPNAFSEIENLSIDIRIVEGTPHWFFLAAGATEKQALISYIDNANIPKDQKNEWIQFIRTIWNKHPVKFDNSSGNPALIPGRSSDIFTLTPMENDTFQKIERYIAEDMEQSAISDSHNEILPMFLDTQHEGFISIASLKESLPSELTSLARDGSRTPDQWYEYPGGIAIHSWEHGYIPYTGLGHAPEKCQEFALDARTDFLSHNYGTAFIKLGYAAHFIEDMGMPYHTPVIQIIPLQFIDDPTYFKQSTISGMILDYYALHNSYEIFVDHYWNNALPNNQASFYDTANSPNDYYSISDPLSAARQHGYDSWTQNYMLVYHCYWQKIKTGEYDFENNPAIIARTKERIYHTTQYTRGLVRYVTGGQYPMLTVAATAGPGGSISPSGAVPVRYGESQTFSITPDSGCTIDEILVDGNPVTDNPYQFTSVTSDHTITATFIQNVPVIIPLCPAGSPFDANKYPQNTLQSEPMTFTCTWDGNGRVYLSGDQSSLIGTFADDGFTVDTPGGIRFDAAGHWAHQHPPLEITSGMKPGSNTLTLTVRNWMGLSMSYGSITGIGTDQVPYIIEVNYIAMTSAIEKPTTDEFPSFITQNGTDLVVNGTIFSDNFPAATSTQV
jgi:hypothetical protein